MLKIKDKIDLEELEKFGFVKCGDSIETYFKAEKSNNWEQFESGIIVNPVNKECQKEIVYYTNSITDGIELDEDSLQLVSTLDTLYDLIKADLVEKVEDK